MPDAPHDIPEADGWPPELQQIHHLLVDETAQWQRSVPPANRVMHFAQTIAHQPDGAATQSFSSASRSSLKGSSAMEQPLKAAPHPARPLRASIPVMAAVVVLALLAVVFAQLALNKHSQHPNNPVVATTPPPIGTPSLYLGSNGDVLKLNQTNGAMQWRTKTAGTVLDAPTVVGSLVYVTSARDAVYALNGTTGKVIWRVPLTVDQYGDSGALSPIIANDVAYFGDDGAHMVVAINASTGAPVWKYPVPGQSGQVGLVGVTYTQGMVYSNWNNTLIALNATTGQLAWSAALPNPQIFNRPTAIGGDIYLSSWIHNGSVVYQYAYKASSGTRLWQSAPFSSASSYITETAYAQGVEYFAVQGVPGSDLYAVRMTDGSVVWKYHASAGEMYTKPVIANGAVFMDHTVLHYPANGNYIVALNATDGKTELWRHVLPYDEGHANAAVNAGTYFVSANTNNGDAAVFALATATGNQIWQTPDCNTSCFFQGGITSTP